MASALLAGSPWTAFADTDNILEVLQNSTVRGKVVDASGEPVIGASVVVKGTTTGVITDLDGNFMFLKNQFWLYLMWGISHRRLL